MTDELVRDVRFSLAKIAIDGGQAARRAAAGDARRKGHYTLMSRATDEIGRMQSHEPRYNNMRKNFSAIVGHSVTVG